jgi:cytochrome P450
LYYKDEQLMSRGYRAAGSDTTAITLRAIFYHLMRNPKASKKLHQEIDEADSSGRLSKTITYAESLQLPYL